MKLKSDSNCQNRLSKETSPYLLQHANNPVDWYPWGNEALDKAKEEDKIILISIGYSACHWCHVMERESFMNQEVAQIMNENFVCIKVDREERPDVDQICMNAVQLISRSGGWPLNCFSLPDGSPVFGGTYFPKDNWIQLLRYMAELYRTEKEKLTEQAKQIKDGLVMSDFIKMNTDKKTFGEQDILTLYHLLEKNFDTIHGGTSGAPKFPMPVSWLFLLRFAFFSGNSQALLQVEKTLDNIASGGIYDHIGGGFARYTVDEKWLVPHFEKMLYDNAQLISLYSEAYKIFHKERYKRVVYETIEFVLRELTSEEGLFCSSLDADSEGEEGKYYVWSKNEIVKLLQNDAEIFCTFYDISSSGNWEYQKNILHYKDQGKDITSKFNLSESEIQSIIERCKNVLYEEREKRIKPGLDDKCLTSWNALMIKALADAYRIFNEQYFLDSALKAGEFLLKHQTTEEGGLLRNYKKGKSSIDAFLDDYGFLIESFLTLYTCTFDEKWIYAANQYATYTLKNFFDRKTSLFFYTHVSKSELVVRKKEISDNVIASSNSAMALNLFLLGKYFDNTDYLSFSEQMLMNIWPQISQHPWYFGNWLRLLTNKVYQDKEIGVTGKDVSKIKQELFDNYLPDIPIAGSESESVLPILTNRLVMDKTLIYVCENNVCKLPVETVIEAIKELK